MKKYAILAIATAMLATPAQAADWSDVKPGTFVGARLTIGGKAGGRPRAALMFAPTQNRISGEGIADMRIGEGIALNLTPGAKPTLTLAGVRADTALGLRRDGDINSDRKLGVSTGGWIAIGVGAAVLAGAAIWYARVVEADRQSD